MKYFALVAALAGCGSMDPERLDEAVVLVWHDRYGAPADTPPPRIEVYVGRCVRMHGDVCVDGVYDPNIHRISLGAARSYHESSLAHELYHADEFRRHGDVDAEHKGRGWAWYVPDAESALADEGL